ncbi:MAG: hypothetical protein IK083_07315 [Abditibacteriota bacterium]|nr:hypothetical protein [Abditibacteriota bacterium]
MKPDKLVLILYLAVFVIFLTIIRMNPLLLGLAGALPALVCALLAFARVRRIRALMMLYGLGIFILQAVFVSNFFLRLFPADNALVMLLLLPHPLAALTLAIAGLFGRKKNRPE